MVHSLSNQSRAQGAAINVPVTSATVRTSTVTAANVFVTDLAVSNGVEFTATSAPTAYTGVRFTNAAYDGALVEKRVSENARWGLGVRASDGTTHVHAGAAGSVVLGHRVSSTSVSPAITVSRAGTGAANVGINTSSPATALHVVGNVHVDGLTRASGALRMYPDHRRQPINYMNFDVKNAGTVFAFGNLYQYSETLGRVERIMFTGYPRWHGSTSGESDVHCVLESPVHRFMHWQITNGTQFAYDNTTATPVWRANVQQVAADANLRTQVRTIETPTSTSFNAPTTIEGAHVTMGFEYPLFVRHVYVTERHGSPNLMVGQVYVVGANVAVENVTTATEWSEIDVLNFTAPENGRVRRDPQPIVKALGLTSSYRTVRLIMYAKFSASAIGSATNITFAINIGRVRVFGMPALLDP
jgi:hypothetical protein